MYSKRDNLTAEEWFNIQCEGGEESDAPNYRDYADSPTKSGDMCSICNHFDNMFCTKYDFIPFACAVCDDFQRFECELVDLTP